MKILLVKPTRDTDGITPPLGLGYLATALRPRHEVRIVDGPKERLNPGKFERILKDYRPGLVGFSVVAKDLYLAAGYLEQVRENLPEAVTVAGGAQPSSEPENTYYTCRSSIDYIFVGEAEKGLPMLADRLEDNRRTLDLNSIPGLFWKEGNEFKRNPVYLEQDLDTLGFPAWDLMDPRTYPPAPHAAFARQFPVATIIASRGCPYDCEFCAAKKILGRKIRRRSVDDVVEEIALLVGDFGVREIHIIDDNFTLDRDYVLDFCEKVSRRFPKLSWACPNGVRLDTLDRELLENMARSGCYALAMGIESGNQEVLDKAGKRQSLETVREKVEMIHRAGILAIGFFILGFPGETIEQMKETVKLSMRLPLTRAQYMFYHPIPGTDIYHRLLREHPENFRSPYSSFEKVAYIENGIDEKYFKRIQRSAFFRFYLRPRQFVHLLRSIKSPGHAYFIMKRIVRWMVMS